jgi:hypothetical protein
MDKRQRLIHYRNGNLTIDLYDDGTKIRQIPEGTDPQPILPESVDLKVTNKCDGGCLFCHENSTPRGQHASLDPMLEYFAPFAGEVGMELAIGGGNPLSWEPLTTFLSRVSHEFGFFPSLTIHEQHLNHRTARTLAKAQEEKSLFGIGISGAKAPVKEAQGLKNVVYHLIMGIDRIDCLSLFDRVLILGYKTVGRGKTYKPDQQNMYEWYTRLPLFFGKVHMSFDNLALEQLNLKRFLNESQWERFYMGNEGKFTMFIDAVEQNYGISSTDQRRFPLTNLEDDFRHVRQIAAFS